MTALERLSVLVGVITAHLAAMVWASQALQHTPPEVVQPTMQGVLVTSELPIPPQPAQPAPPAPQTETRPEAARPKPRPPEPRPVPKPLPPPPPLPPSERAIETPQPEPQAPAPATAERAAPRDSTPAPQHQPPPAGPPGPAGPASEAPFTPPRVEASHLNNPAPPYPPLSRRMREEGRVLLDVHILPDGSVGEVKLRESSGFRRLDDAARSAVAHWRYVPATRGGKAVAFWYVQPVVFSLTH